MTDRNAEIKGLAVILEVLTWTFHQDKDRALADRWVGVEHTPWLCTQLCTLAQCTPLRLSVAKAGKA